jgi:hypothetical protein
MVTARESIIVIPPVRFVQLIIFIASTTAALPILLFLINFSSCQRFGE